MVLYFLEALVVLLGLLVLLLLVGQLYPLDQLVLQLPLVRQVRLGLLALVVLVFLVLFPQGQLAIVDLYLLQRLRDLLALLVRHYRLGLQHLRDRLRLVVLQGR